MRDRPIVSPASRSRSARAENSHARALHLERNAFFSCASRFSRARRVFLVRDAFFSCARRFSRARAVFLVREPFFSCASRFSRTRAVFLAQKPGSREMSGQCRARAARYIIEAITHETTGETTMSVKLILQNLADWIGDS
jgi:hypothetical protein